MFLLEEKHWWYRGMRSITESIFASSDVDRGGGMLLDLGCGTGANLHFLSGGMKTVGMDIVPQALSSCRARGIRNLIQGSVSELPLGDGSADMVTCFDVLYHRGVSDDLAALREMRRVLKPGGHLLVRVAAYDWLRGRHDDIVHTRHRYTLGELRKKLRDAGFQIRRMTYANTLLFPIAVVKRIAEKFSRDAHENNLRSDLETTPPWMETLFGKILDLESALVRQKWRLPFGLSVMALAKKT